MNVLRLPEPSKKEKDCLAVTGFLVALSRSPFQGIDCNASPPVLCFPDHLTILSHALLSELGMKMSVYV